MTSSPDFQKADHYTLESLCRMYDQWMADGANLIKAKKYSNVVYPIYQMLFITFINRRQKQKNSRACKYSWSTYTAGCYRQNFKRD